MEEPLLFPLVRRAKKERSSPAAAQTRGFEMCSVSSTSSFSSPAAPSIFVATSSSKESQISSFYEKYSLFAVFLKNNAQPFDEFLKNTHLCCVYKNKNLVNSTSVTQLEKHETCARVKLAQLSVVAAAL